MCKAWDDMKEEAMRIGQKIGEEKAVSQTARLFDALVSVDRLDDFKHCLNDKAFRQQILEEFQIS